MLDEVRDAARIAVARWRETMGRAHAALAAGRGQGTVEYVGLVLLMAVLIAGVVKASGSFSDTDIAEAVVKRLKAAIEGVGGGR